jgi:hypothetical protein
MHVVVGATDRRGAVERARGLRLPVLAQSDVGDRRHRQRRQCAERCVVLCRRHHVVAGHAGRVLGGSLLHLRLRLSRSDVGDRWRYADTGVTAQVYNTASGTTWTLVTAAPGFSARTSGKALVFRTPERGVDLQLSDHLAARWRQRRRDLAGSVARQPERAGVHQHGTAVAHDRQRPVPVQHLPEQHALLLKNSTDFFVFDGYLPARVTDTNYPPVTVPGIVTLNGRVYVMTPQGEIHGCSLENPSCGRCSTS